MAAIASAVATSHSFRRRSITISGHYDTTRVRCHRARGRRDGLGRRVRAGPPRPVGPGAGTVPAGPRPRQLARAHAHHPPGVLRTPGLRPPRAPGVRAVVRPRAADRPAPAHRVRLPEHWAPGRRSRDRRPGVRPRARARPSSCSTPAALRSPVPAVPIRPTISVGVLEHDAGFLYVEDCVRAHLDAARRPLARRSSAEEPVDRMDVRRPLRRR